MSDITRLVEYVTREAGDQVRAIGKFAGVETDLVYVRDDLREAAVTERLEPIHDNITWAWSPPDDELDADLGRKRASLQVRERAVILHLPTGEDRGVLVGLEPEAASDLTTFIGECLQFVSEPVQQV